MKHNPFFIFHGSIYAIFALGLFFLPIVIWPLYGLEINDQYAYFLSQHTSIFLGGLSAVSFLFNAVKDKQAVKQLVKALLFTNLLGILITSYACFQGIFVGFGWSDPLFFTILSILSFLQLKRLNQ